MSVDVRIANDRDHPAIETLFEQWGQAFRHSIDDQEFVVDVEGEIIAALRLSFEKNTFRLRSLFVDKQHRGRNFARQLLALANKELGIAEAYCLCPRNLASLFGEIGFLEIAGLTAPTFLKDRRDHLRESKGDIILMRRSFDVEVRPITVDDLGAAMELIQEFGLAEVDALSSNDIRSIYSKIGGNGGAVIGAFQGSEMIGTCTVNVCANLSWSGRPYSIIENFIVTKARRDKGVGKYLLLFSTHFAASKNCYKVALMTRDNTAAAAMLYSSAGFSDDKVGYQIRFGA